MTRRGETGFNLLEMLLAGSLFAWVALLFLALWSSYYQALGRARYETAAQYLAEQTMQQALAAGYEEVDVLAGPPRALKLTHRIRGQEVRVEYSCSVRTAPAGSDLKSITVRLTWMEPAGKRELELETLVARPQD